MAETIKCSDCHKPLRAEIHVDDPDLIFVYCPSPNCNPMLLANLQPPVTIQDETWHPS